MREKWRCGRAYRVDESAVALRSNSTAGGSSCEPEWTGGRGERGGSSRVAG
jgi:hypothetical protein